MPVIIGPNRSDGFRPEPNPLTFGGCWRGLSTAAVSSAFVVSVSIVRANVVGQRSWSAAASSWSRNWSRDRLCDRGTEQRVQGRELLRDLERDTGRALAEAAATADRDDRTGSRSPGSSTVAESSSGRPTSVRRPGLTSQRGRREHRAPQAAAAFRSTPSGSRSTRPPCPARSSRPSTRPWPRHRTSAVSNAKQFGA